MIDFFLPQLTLALPVADGFADDFAGGGIFTRIDGGFENADLLGGESHADFLNVGHRA